MVIDTPANIDGESADFSRPEEPDHPNPPKRLDHGQVEDICELVLKQAFNVDLQDVDFPSDALESVTHCLEELSTVVYSCLPLKRAAPVREVPAGNHSPTEDKSRGKKRANSRDNKAPGDDDQQDAQSGDEDASPTSSKKIRIEPPDNRYSCPFRKRNPLKFNIRDYNTCATSSFSDFTNLKRHIKLYHSRQARLPYVCFRCGANQETRDRLLAHVQQPPERMCAVRCEAQQTDPEDGITPDVEELLNERKSKAKIDTWPGLWRALFGLQDDILSSEFVPPVEWDEVKNEFEITRDILKNRVQLESVTIKELRPEAQAYVAAHMDHTCWDYIHSVLSACRLQADYQSEKHHKRRRSQKSNIATHNSPTDSLLPPLTQRHILPKPTTSSSGDSLPIGPNMAIIQSNGSSLSSSWETAISNISSSNLQSTSSSFSLTTPGEPPQSVQSFVYLPAPDLTLPHSIPDDIPCKVIVSVDEFPAYGPDVDGGGFDLGGLFGYTDVYDGQDGGYSVYDGDGSGFDLGISSHE
ncbi:hypothetical protein GE09DRAFT_1067392 [Coniochaeta sp. 2T2.1]|nr:hypothetical protein GE09DRAFT_1067392 [Coniochaeta sp. 2T2.1]